MLQMYHQTKLALGSDTTFVLVSDRSESKVMEVFRELWSATYRFERQFSRFIPNSELSNSNRLAGSVIPITPEFYRLLHAAQKLAYVTDGLYNPFILPALQRAGYTNSFVPAYAEDTHDDVSNRRVVPIERMQLTLKSLTIPYGTALDIGGCGKGYLADQLAEMNIPDWVHGYWLSFGGDLIGSGYDADDKPWHVEIPSAASQDEYPWYVETTGKQFAVATSGIGVRTGVKNGKSWHHIIDPHTLQPSETDVRMATVVHPSATKADVFASCAILLGSKAAPGFLEKHSVSAACLQGESEADCVVTGRGVYRQNLATQRTVHA